MTINSGKSSPIRIILSDGHLWGRWMDHRFGIYLVDHPFPNLTLWVPMTKNSAASLLFVLALSLHGTHTHIMYAFILHSLMTQIRSFPSMQAQVESNENERDSVSLSLSLLMLQSVMLSKLMGLLIEEF